MRIIIFFQLFLAAVLSMTCERTDVHRLALYGVPPRNVLYIFPVYSHYGNLGGRNGADQLCRDEGRFIYHSLGLTTVKAFISVSDIDDIRSLVTPEWWYYPVYGIHPVNGPTLISETWAALWDGSIDLNLQTTLGIGGSWWSGSNADGTVNPAGVCSEWDVYDSSAGQTGSDVGTDATWISSTTSACNMFNTVLCLAY